MISVSNFHINSQYFDEQGKVHQVENEISEPRPIIFKLENDRLMSIFLANNPWRASDSSNDNIVYQSCIFCGLKRFEDATFNGSKEIFKKYVDRHLRPGSGESLLLCKERECQKSWYDLADNMKEEKFHAIFSAENDLLPEFIESDANYIRSLSIKSAKKT